MRAADDRRHVMLAVRGEFDVAQHDHLVVTGNFFEGAAQFLARIFGIARKPVLVGIGYARRRVDQTFAGWIVAGPAQQDAHGIFGLGLADGGKPGGFLFHGLKFPAWVAQQGCAV